jgi:DNA-binding beta-propeller fold protein YncE
MDHTFHLHAHRWVDPGTSNIVDTKLLKAPASSTSFVIRAGDQVGTGYWQYHCHVFAHMEAGMHSAFHVGPAGSNTASLAGASPRSGDGGHRVWTFELTDNPGEWFRSVRGNDLAPVTVSKSVEVATAGDTVNFVMSDVAALHTVTSLIWPTGADHMPFDEVTSYMGGATVHLSKPGLYVFTCKVHPYMFGAVIADNPATQGLDLGDCITVASYGGLSVPTTSDLATRLLLTFFIATVPSNWADFDTATNPSHKWHIAYPDVPVNVGPSVSGSEAVVNLKQVLEARYGQDKDLPALFNPTTAGVGEVWVDTQFENTAGKTKSGAATAVNATTWQVSKKFALPSVNMNNPHNMWTDRDQTKIYHTQWFDNYLTIFDRNTGALQANVKVGADPAHVMTRANNDDLHVSLNGENGIAEIKAGTTTVNRIIPMQSADHDPSHPHAHWMSADGQKMVTPNQFTEDSTDYNFGSGSITSITKTGHHPLATGMIPDSTKYYVANFLDSTISVISMNPSTGYPEGQKIRDINLIEDYNPITGEIRDAALNDVFPGSATPDGVVAVGALPIQTPVSPDGKAMVTANTLTATITVVNPATDRVVAMLSCDAGCHGVNFGAKQGGGYYAYVSSKFSNEMIVVDPDPDNNGNPSDAAIVGRVLLKAAPSTAKDDTPTGNLGMGGQGVLAIPNVYNGWVQNLPASWKSQLTPQQQNPSPLN